MTFPDQLRALRARKNLSQSQAAAVIGMSVRTLQDWELGRSKPPAWAQTSVLGRLRATRKKRKA